MPPEKVEFPYDFLRRHYPHQVQGSKVYLPLSLSHKLPCYVVVPILMQIISCVNLILSESQSDFNNHPSTMPHHGHHPVLKYAVLQLIRIFINHLFIPIRQQSFNDKSNRKDGQQIKAKSYQGK